MTFTITCILKKSHELLSRKAKNSKVTGLSDHDIVLAEVAMKPTQAKPKRMTIHLFNKADWTSFRSEIKDHQAKFRAEHHGRPVDELWTDLTNNIDQVTDQCIPTINKG